MQDELAVAGVFVRMFILQPTFQLADPAGLTKGLVSWVYSNAGHAWALPGAQMLLDFCAMCTAASRQMAMCNGNTDSSHLAAAIGSAHSLNVYIPAAWMADRPIHSIRLGRGVAPLHCVTYSSCPCKQCQARITGGVEPEVRPVLHRRPQHRADGSAAPDACRGICTQHWAYQVLGICPAPSVHDAIGFHTGTPCVSSGHISQSRSIHVSARASVL